LLSEQPLPLPFQFQELSGPKHIPPPDSPIAYFHFFFIDLILTLMVTESNRITMHKMKGFLAFTVNTCIIKKPTIASYWSAFCSQTLLFPFPCFFHLVSNEGLPGPGKPEYDPCARYQTLVDRANWLLGHHNAPDQEINVNESLVGTKNRTTLMQYLHSKQHHRRGIKFWMLCNSLSIYCLAFFIYRGAGLRKMRATSKKKLA
jgi:hypothetical protein